jgi:cytochrome b6-f complex iron-sulfur subunit
MAETSRRDFMKAAGWAAAGTSFVVVGLPIIAYLYPKDLAETPDEPVPVCPPEQLSVGSSKTVQYGRYPALIIHTADGLRAYSAVCTHFACIVSWNADDGKIECPCHDGIFDPENGAVLAGPPPEPLMALPVAIADDGLIYVGESTGEAAS